jgi:hypothetical protein
MLAIADDILRAKPWTTRSLNNGRALVWLLASIIVCGGLYGAVMGTFRGLAPETLVQMMYSAVKVPLMLLATFVISLPSFFVVNTLLGLRRDLAQALRALLATQAGLSIILASLAPFTALWYASFSSYSSAVAFNGLMFAIASFSAQWLLRGYYMPLVQRNSRHRVILRVWVFIFAFVGIQMAWVLRPFVGDPRSPLQFFRDDVRSVDAYVTVVRLVTRILP